MRSLSHSNTNIVFLGSQSDNFWLCFRMSDLAAPFLTIFEDDAIAFWCFERLLQRTSKNFRHDEVGMRCAYSATMHTSYQRWCQKPHRLVCNGGTEVCAVSGSSCGRSPGYWSRQTRLCSTTCARLGRASASLHIAWSSSSCAASSRYIAAPGPGRPHSVENTSAACP